MICPKCGFEQEERNDCIKCGVIFSKYYALQQRGRPSRLEAVEPEKVKPPRVEAPEPEKSRPSRLEAVELEKARPPRAEAPEPVRTEATVPSPAAEELYVEEPTQLQHQIKELNHRFAELEKERSEQTRWRGEVSLLEQRLHGSLKEIEGRLIALQRRVEESPPPPPMSEDLPALRNEIQQEMSAIQQKLAAMDIAPLLERLDRMEAGSGETPQQPDPGIMLELGNITKELEALRTSLQNVTIRYSEIGELKKNHLTLSHALDSIQQELARGKEGASNEAAQKTAELDKEVSALRAEQRQLLKELETSDAPGASGLHEIKALKEELQTLAESRISQEQKLVVLEDQLTKQAEQADAADSKALDRIHEIETRFSELETRNLPAPATGGKYQGTDPLLELGKVLKEVDGLRSALKNITVRYSEIGELKKNDLVLSNSIESLQRELETLKEAGAKEVPRQLRNLEADGVALREEVRNLAKQLEASEACIAAVTEELKNSLADNRIDPKVLVKIQEMDGRFAELEGRLSAFSQEHGQYSNQAMQELGKVLRELDGFRASLQNVTVRYSEVADLKRTYLTITDKQDALDARIAALTSQPPPEPLPPLETDVHAIRENLEDIRRFMSALSQKQ